MYHYYGNLSEMLWQRRYTVDLVNYHTIKHPELKNHIDRVGLPFYEKLVGEEQMPGSSV